MAAGNVERSIHRRKSEKTLRIAWNDWNSWNHWNFFKSAAPLHPRIKHDSNIFDETIPLCTA
jgi:hypothetical protein